LANIKSQIKRNKQNEAHRLKNAQSKSSIRTASKNVLKAAESKSTPDELKKIFLKFVRIIDRAAGNRVVHKKTAARKKSRLAKRVNTALKNLS
jgi:small subunit ribosomal protein S20